MTPAQNAYYADENNTLDLRTSIDGNSVLVFKSDTGNINDAYFWCRGDWNIDKGNPPTFGFKDVPGYNADCLSYGDFTDLPDVTDCLLYTSRCVSETGSNTVYTIVGNGYIVIGDEVYPIKPDILTVPTSQPVYWVVVQEKFQNEIFADNSEAQVYERRYVKLSTTYTKSDMYVGRNDVVTFRNKILAIVTDYLDKTIIEKDMKAQLSLSEVVSGKAEIIYRAKQTGNETVYFNILAAANTGTSMIAPEVNGKRR